MIYCVLLNPSIDNILEIPHFEEGNTYKIKKYLRFPVGKAISVALTLKELGEKVKVIALIGKNQIPLYKGFLDERKIRHELIAVEGETRSNITIMDDKRKRNTHLRFPGFSVKESEITFLKKAIETNLSEGDFIIISGSIPRNFASLSPNFIFKISRIAKERGAYFIIDTDGEPLKDINTFNPHIIKANLVEMGQIIGKNLLKSQELNHKPSRDELISLVLKCREKELDTKFVILTLAEYGSILYSKKDVYYAWMENMDSTELSYSIGCGDSFLGGLIAGMQRKYSVENLLKIATACGAANTFKLGAGILEKEKVNELKQKIFIEKLMM